MATLNKQVHLASRPDGEPKTANFRFVEAPVAALRDGQVLVRNHFLSLDPYMRGRMNDAKSYAVPQELNAVMGGGTAGEVVESKNPGYQQESADEYRVQRRQSASCAPADHRHRQLQ